MDENLAGQLDIFPEAWALMGTELPENILGQMSLANCECQPDPYFSGLKSRALLGLSHPSLPSDLFLCRIRGLH